MTLIVCTFVFVFTFVSLCVAINRACDVLQRHAQSNERLANVTHYRGDTFNRHGRAIVRANDAIRRVI